MQAEPYHNISIDDGHADFYLNPTPHSLHVPGSSQNFHINHHQTSSFAMQDANQNCPATTGYTATPSFSSCPCYGTFANANAYRPIPSLWQSRSDRHAYASVNPVGDRRYHEFLENAPMHPPYDQPLVQSNYRQTIGPSHDSTSSEREQLTHSDPQRISGLQVTNFPSTNANSHPQEQGQPAQHQLIRRPPRLLLPSAPTAEHQEPSKRAKRFWSKLKASSGVVFASQLQPGQSPFKPKDLTRYRHADRVRNVSCPICRALFASPYHIQAHFPVCVQRNGNPDGLFWDETLPLRWRRYGKSDTIRADKLN